MENRCFSYWYGMFLLWSWSNKTKKISDVFSREQVRPDYEQFVKKIELIKNTELAIFMCAIYSFYNSEDGLRLLQKYTSLHSLKNVSDSVIRELRLNHYFTWTQSFSVELNEN